MNWKTILVPHDFSASAAHATEIARDEAKQRGSRVILLHVIELPHQLDAAALVSDGEGHMIPLQSYATARATQHLQELADALAADGIAATAVVVIGSPVDEIERVVAENAVDVIVMGTHGRTGIRKLIAGSVTERVVRTASVPVLTIRHPGE
ncbi:MAG: universal stress protein [Deltaproteobacteria bacterium]|nr:universal stress protein [Deltaproteobacteria bacterium]